METAYSKLMQLVEFVEEHVPDKAQSDQVWEALGWNDEYEAPCKLLWKEEGIDLLKELTPELCDIVSIVEEANLCFPFDAHKFSWDAILDGEVAIFEGFTPKERMLSVLSASLQHCGN